MLSKPAVKMFQRVIISICCQILAQFPLLVLCHIPILIANTTKSLYIIELSPISLSGGAFSHACHLERILISKTIITSLDRQAFVCLDVLENLALEEGELDHLPEGVFKPLVKLEFLNLTGESG